MSRLEKIELLQKEIKNSYDRIEKLKAIQKFYSEIGEPIGNLSLRLEEVVLDLDKILKTESNRPLPNNAYEWANFSATNTQSKEFFSYTKQVDAFINGMSHLVEIEEDYNQGSISAIEVAKEMIQMASNINQYGSSSKESNLNNMRTYYNNYVKSLLSDCSKNLSKEDKEQLKSFKPVLINKFKGIDLEKILEDNSSIEQETEQYIEKNSKGTFENLTDIVLSSFKKLDSVLEINSSDGMVSFDPNDITHSLNLLEDSIVDLGAHTRNRNNASSNTLSTYFTDKSSTFSERTNQTIRALADFQTATLEQDIAKIRNLLSEESLSSTKRKNTIIKFAKSAAWYMSTALVVQGKSNTHAESVMKEVNEVIKISNTLELDNANFEKKNRQESSLKTQAKNLQRRDIPTQNSTLGNKQPEAQSTSTQDSKEPEPSETKTTSQPNQIKENIELKQDDVTPINQKVQNSEDLSTDEEKSSNRPENNVSNQVHEIKQQPEIPSQKVEMTTQDNIEITTQNKLDITQEIPKNNDNKKGVNSDMTRQKPHILDRYKTTLEMYDIQFLKSSDRPNGYLVIIDRKTGQEVSEGVMSKEEKTALAKDLAFAKSWVKACGNELSTTGSKNEYGVDTRQWEYAFNDGAKSTFDTIVDVLKTNTDKNLNTQKIIEIVSRNSSYKYSQSICEGLLDKQNINYDWQLKNIHETLLKTAGFSLNQARQNEADGMDM